MALGSGRWDGGFVISYRVRLARALEYRPFALLWVGQTISGLGDTAFYTAVAWQVLLLTGSATAIGAVLVAQAVPRLLFLLVGGVFADRLPRRMVMLVSDVGRALAVAIIAVLGATHNLHIADLVALALVFGVADAFFFPAYQSIPPQMVEIEVLPSANSLTQMSQQISQLVGPAIGAAAITLASPSAAFAFDALTFVVSAVTLFFVRVPRVSRPAGEAGAKRRGVLGEIWDGLHYVSRSSWLWVTIVIFGVANVGIAPLSVALPKLVKDAYGTGVWLLSASLVAAAIGSLVASLIIGQLGKMHRRGVIAYSGSIVTGLALAALGVPAVLSASHVALPVNTGPVVVLVASVTFGASLSVFSVIWTTVMQELVPVEMLGRVTSIDWLGSLAFWPVGLALAGVLADKIGPAWVFVGGGVLVAGLSALGLLVKGVRELD